MSSITPSDINLHTSGEFQKINEISIDTYINIMAQYPICFKAYRHPELQ